MPRPVVLQIQADARQFVAHRDSMLRQFLARTDAREQQQLRRSEGAAGDDGFAPRVKCAARRFDANAGFSFKQKAQRMRVRHRGEIVPPGRAIGPLSSRGPESGPELSFQEKEALGPRLTL